MQARSKKHGFIVLKEMLFLAVGLVAMMLFFLPGPAKAQFQEGDPGGAKMGTSQVQHWKMGVIVTAAGGPCQGIVAYCPIPIEWPEQQIKVVEEEVSPTARISYETVNQTVKLMVVKIPSLAAGRESKALVTFEITRSAQLPPSETGKFVLPNPRSMNRRIRPYLGPSPLIESRNPQIRKEAKQFEDMEGSAWEKVEAIYDWVREKVQHQHQDVPIKGALAALRDGTGDCEELTSLFIAMCRANDIPARTVWVPGHCYPEFYLEDEQGEGHWFPCQAAGSREFGGITEHRPILQKGDNFRPPWNRRDRQRYLAEHLTGAGGRPKVRFVRELLDK